MQQYKVNFPLYFLRSLYFLPKISLHHHLKIKLHYALFCSRILIWENTMLYLVLAQVQYDKYSAFWNDGITTRLLKNLFFWATAIVNKLLLRCSYACNKARTRAMGTNDICATCNARFCMVAILVKERRNIESRI